MKVKITWNGEGGELDSRTVTVRHGDEPAIAKALIDMVGSGGIVTPGDSITVEEIKS